MTKAPVTIWIGRPGPDGNWALFLNEEDADNARAAGWQVKRYVNVIECL